MALTVVESMAALMAGDAGIAALLTGSVFADDDSAAFPIHPEREDAPYETVSNQPRLKPCAVVSESTDVPAMKAVPGMRLFVRVGFYQADGYQDIREAAALTRALFDPDDVGERHGPLTDGRYYIVRYVDTPIRAGRDDQVMSADSENGVPHLAQRYAVELGPPV